MAPRKAAAKKATPSKARPKAKAASPSASPSAQVDEQLARYRSMRDFGITAEPSGTGANPSEPREAENGTKYPFVIQKHAASHLHYDFRLGWNGVLKSWAVAKGPSYVVADKRLAVQVEDHPMEYGGFEGIIPAGQYGGGTVMVWDQGTWQPQPGHTDVDAGLRDGQLKFILDGTKLQGKWALIRIQNRENKQHEPRPGEKKSRWSSSTKPNWLLIKEHDDHERPPEAPPITDADPSSAVTGRSLDQIAANEDHVWNSNRDDKSKSQLAETRVPHDRGGQAEAILGSVTPPPPAPSLEHLPTELQPTFLKPQLAQETESPPDVPGWLHELKLDGYRMQARKQGTKVQMFTRSGIDWTDRVKAVAAEVARPPHRPTAPSMAKSSSSPKTAPPTLLTFRPPSRRAPRNPLTYFCFDPPPPRRPQPPRPPPAPNAKPCSPKSSKLPTPPGSSSPSTSKPTAPRCSKEACELHAEGIISKKQPTPPTAVPATATGSNPSASTSRSSSSAATPSPANPKPAAPESARSSSAITTPTPKPAATSSTPAAPAPASTRSSPSPSASASKPPKPTPVPFYNAPSRRP